MHEIYHLGSKQSFSVTTAWNLEFQECQVTTQQLSCMCCIGFWSFWMINVNSVVIAIRRGLMNIVFQRRACYRCLELKHLLQIFRRKMYNPPLCLFQKFVRLASKFNAILKIYLLIFCHISRKGMYHESNVLETIDYDRWFFFLPTLALDLMTFLEPRGDLNPADVDRKTWGFSITSYFVGWVLEVVRAH